VDPKETTMRAFIIAAGTLIMAVSPWLIPSVASAAKMTREQARNACRSENPQNRSGDKGNARRMGNPSNQVKLHQCIEEKMAGK
jgi:hypothetical protein